MLEWHTGMSPDPICSLSFLVILWHPTPYHNGSPDNGGSAMTFDDILAQVLDLLQREKRVSYRALKRRFDLDDNYLEDVKDELIYAKKLARDEDDRVLVWIGETESASPPTSIPPSAPAADHWPSPLAYTPS